MTDSEDRKLDQLLDNINQLRKDVTASGAHADERASENAKQLAKTNERFATQAKWTRDDNARQMGRLDLVAAHLARLDDDLASIKEVVNGTAEDVDHIKRRLDSDLDRLDEHGTRIEILEKKSAHLPASK